MSVIYVVGRMRGIRNFNYEAFSNASRELRGMNWKVINPHAEDRNSGFDIARYDPDDHGLTWSDYPPDFDVGACRQRNKECVANADAIFVLKGGLGENGVRELEAAARAGKRIFYEDEGYPTTKMMEPVEIPDPYRTHYPETKVTSLWMTSSAPDETRVVDPDTGGMKGSKPEQCDQIPTKALLELAKHYGVGSLKYQRFNFRRGYSWSLSYNACMRHLLQFWGGENNDKETGSKHVIAAAWHCFCLATFMDEHPEKDDRYDGVKRVAEDANPKVATPDPKEERIHEI